MARSETTTHLPMTGPPEELQQLPGYPILEAFRALRHAMDDALREVDLTTPQWGALACLGFNDGLTGAEMARMHHLTPQTMHTILLNLEGAGLVVRDRDPEHGTLLRARLTDEGRERLDQAMERVAVVQGRLIAELDDGERATLAELLHRCTMSLHRDESGQAADAFIDAV
jgi:DNA-binding MarR family transcriptional regulator